jgi:hypothetical protein
MHVRGVFERNGRFSLRESDGEEEATELLSELHHGT